MRKKIKNSILFLNEYKKNIITTWAIAESSEDLAEKITSIIDLSKQNSIVEFWSWTWVFTKKILGKKWKNTNFFSIEINKFFAEKSKKNCPNAIIYNDDANNIKKYLEKHNLKKTNCIISWLPWTCFDKKTQKDLIENIFNSLEEWWFFLTFSYIQSKVLPTWKTFKKIISEKFKNVSESKIIWKNIPPAFIYICEK